VTATLASRYDVVVIGAGHNGLVAAAYLARAGLSVLVVERQDHPGGAAVSATLFPGMAARLSRYSYLVSLFPDKIVRHLGLSLRTASRAIASYTPVHRHGRDEGLLIPGGDAQRAAAAVAEFTGSNAEGAAWRSFGDRLQRMAQRVFPTLTEPLPHRNELRRKVNDDPLWEQLMERPLGELVEETFRDDIVRGVVFTDAVIGTMTHAHDPSLRQNRCFLYHVIGGGTGQWRVPIGGMGTLIDDLVTVGKQAGVELRTGIEATSIATDGNAADITLARRDGEGTSTTVTARFVVAGIAPTTLRRLLGEGPPAELPEGSQVKINMLLTRLPRLRSGIPAQQAFTGTLHIGEGYDALRVAYEEAVAGRRPSHPPLECYSHTLTDPSVLSLELARTGHHAVTAFGVLQPARLLTGPNAAEDALASCLDAIDTVLAESIRDCLAADSHGLPCVEIRTPSDLEQEIGLPGGHIFHSDLDFPFAIDESRGSWGTETVHPAVIMGGSGARRGGAVSGIPGHNAAMDVLGRLAQRDYRLENTEARRPSSA
jgi:phytoene dehydrogenase-like protein